MKIIESIKAAYAAHLQSSANLAESSNALAAATNNQTAAIRELHEALAAIQVSTAYLASSEKEHRTRMGQKVSFD